MTESQAMVLAQLLPWAGFRCDAPEVATTMAQLNDGVPFLFVIELRGRTARILDKPAHFPVEETAGTRSPSNNLLTRAHAYRRFFETTLATGGGLDGAIRLVLCTGDWSPQGLPLPVFAFQKPRGSRVVLLPDIDFLRYDFYADAAFVDQVSFAEKGDRALFVGSTSGGGTLTAEAVRALRAPRLRAAVHFRGSPRVDFYLPRIVQCADEAAMEAIRELDVTGRPLGWAESYRYRYLVSMDGNGATCSRVLLALGSNGVPLKYDSPHMLYYFDHLIPWVHYIPIGEDDDVVRAMDVCSADPALAQAIVAAGQSFHRAHLGREAVIGYARSLLETYRAFCFGG